ncbi:MAG: TonB family protein, partial [Prevotella sp.]
SGIDIREYKTLLIRKAVSSGSYTFANSFNHSLIKKRLTMMLREKSNRWMLSKALYVIPVAFVALSAFATNELEPALENAKSVVTIGNKVTDNLSMTQTKAEKTLFSTKENKSDMVKTGTSSVQTVKLAAPQANDGNKVYATVEELPYYLGGPKELMNYIRDNIRYPKTAMSCGVEGRIIVQFVIDKNGKVKDVQIIRSLFDKYDVHKSINQSADNISAKTDVKATENQSVTETQYAVAVKELEDEATRIVSEMKGWEPGKIKGEPVSTKYTMPITFKLK